MSVWLLVGLGMIALGTLMERLGRASSRPRPRPAPPAPDWESRVMLQSRGNREAVERAVAAKRLRFPRATRAELLELVYWDYLRDR